MTMEVMSGIWSNRVDYSVSIGSSHWMDSGYLLPVIVYMYIIPHLVVYDNSRTHTKHIDGSRCFHTTMYCYDDSQCRVSTKTRSGFEHNIVARRAQETLISTMFFVLIETNNIYFI
jgi:hypothetical protein